MTTTETISAILTTDGRYRLVREPIHLEDVPFEFDAVMVGPDQQENLVLVLDSNAATVNDVARRVRTFALVLSRMGSHRSITLVVVGPSRDGIRYQSLEDVCRVIKVDGSVPLPLALRPIMPLVLPPEQRDAESAISALKQELQNHFDNHIIQRLLRASRSSADAVKLTFYNDLDRACTGEPQQEVER